jgi:ribosomal protein L40E
MSDRESGSVTSSSEVDGDAAAFQTLTFMFKAVGALYHEGSTGQICRACGERNKRYYRLVLTNGGDAVICRACFSDAGGRETGYDLKRSY